MRNGHATRILSEHAAELLRARELLMRGELTDEHVRALIEIAEGADALITNDANGMGLGQTVRDSEAIEVSLARFRELVPTAH